jgi:hypothetical protein
MRLDRVLPALLLLCAAATHAQFQMQPMDPDWKELEAPAPPPLRTSGLIPLEVERSALRFGVDPDSVSVGQDRIVRYVVVASGSSGAVNAMYEGIHCKTGEFKVYARHNPGTGWTIVGDSQWRSLHAQPQSRHSMVVARTAACIGHGSNRSAAQVVRDLRAPADTRFYVN